MSAPEALDWITKVDDERKYCDHDRFPVSGGRNAKEVLLCDATCIRWANVFIEVGRKSSRKRGVDGRIRAMWVVMTA